MTEVYYAKAGDRLEDMPRSYVVPAHISYCEACGCYVRVTDEPWTIGRWEGGPPYAFCPRHEGLDRVPYDWPGSTPEEKAEGWKYKRKASDA